MELYAIPKDMKLIHSITNGKPNSLLRFLTDLQKHVCGIDDTRVKEEGYERAVCQANTDEATWHCKERVVSGMDSTKTKLLLIGWVGDHEKEKGKLEYIGETHWNTASYRGAESCVNEWLLENKIIPKIWSKGEPNSCYEVHKCRGGYYTPYYVWRQDTSKYQILEV